MREPDEFGETDAQYSDDHQEGDDGVKRNGRDGPFTMLVTAPLEFLNGSSHIVRRTHAEELMMFDLSQAMRRKEEFESSRLMDFEFRLRARTAKLMAQQLARDETDLVGRTVDRDHAQFMAELSGETGMAAAELQALWIRLESRARQSLIDERGDPAPYRMA